jgi:ribosomal protein S18 acetylase RimI-like enzyme
LIEKLKAYNKPAAREPFAGAPGPLSRSVMIAKGLSVKIRSLKESDLQAVRNLTASTQELAPDRDSIYWLLSEFFEKTSFVVSSENKLAGFLLGFMSQTKTNQGYVYSIGVAAEHRGKGIGKLLIESFQNSIHSLGADAIYLTTTPDNHMALGFYGHMGSLKNTKIAQKVQ